MISRFSEVIENVMFFFAMSSFLISVQPPLTIDSESAAVSFTLAIRSISWALLWFIVSSCIRAVSAASARVFSRSTASVILTRRATSTGDDDDAAVRRDARAEASGVHGEQRAAR